MDDAVDLSIGHRHACACDLIELEATGISTVASLCKYLHNDEVNDAPRSASTRFIRSFGTASTS